MSDIDDFLKQAEELKTKQVLKSGESYDEIDVICPYCAYRPKDTWEWNIPPNGEEQEEQCPSCDRHFMVSGEIRYSTRRLK